MSSCSHSVKPYPPSFLPTLKSIFVIFLLKLEFTSKLWHTLVLLDCLSSFYISILLPQAFENASADLITKGPRHQENRFLQDASSLHLFQLKGIHTPLEIL